jgi:lysophospholipase
LKTDHYEASNTIPLIATTSTSCRQRPAPLYTEIAEGPSDGKAYWLQTEDKLRLRAGLWHSNRTKDGAKDGTRNGTVLLFPGRTGYIERCGRIASRLSEQGFASFVIDWRGHGLSDRLTEDRKTCHIDQFSDYQLDVAAMINAAEELDLPKPWYLVGNSMGACIGLRALSEGLTVAACAFVAPMWAINLPPVKRAGAWALSSMAQGFGKGHIYAPGYDGQSYVLKARFEGNTLTQDPDMYQHWSWQARSRPDLSIGGPSLGWLFQSLKECRSLSKIRSPEIPCIAFCGDQDEDIEIRAIEERMARWPNGSFELVRNAKHDLMSETPEIRESVITKICDLFTTAGR